MEKQLNEEKEAKKKVEKDLVSQKDRL